MLSSYNRNITQGKKMDSQNASLIVEDGNCETENEFISSKDLFDEAFNKN